MAGAAIPNPQPPQVKATVTVPPLTDQQKNDWNQFIEFTDKEGYKGNPVLDDRDKQLGLYLMQKYKALNPKSTITYQDVPRVQSELQDYRTNLLNQYKKGLVVPSETMKDPETELMPGLSKVDGWLGSKTSSYKFPVAKATTSQGKTIDYGTNVAAYDKDRLANKMPK